MDPDALREALKRWTDNEVIDESAADRIRQFESIEAANGGDVSTTDASITDTSTTTDASTTDSSTVSGILGDRRLIVALALMGGVLVAIGTTAFLLERWDSIPRAIRAVAVLAVPVAAALAGNRLRAASPLTGHGLWLLAALFTGVTAFQLAELAGVDVDTLEPWLLLAWTAVVLAIAVGLDSRPITAVAGVLGAATLVSGVTGNPFLLVGFYGGVLYAAGLFAASAGATGDGHPEPGAPFGGTLRWVGGTLAAAVVAGIGVAGDPPPITDDPGTVAVAVVALAAASAAVVRTRISGRTLSSAFPAVVAPLALGVAWAFGALAGLGQLGIAVVGLGCLLALLVALVAAAVGLREPALVNVATLGFLFGVVAILVGPLTDAISGSLALVVAGLALLAAGLGAERGRRRLLSRIE
ncbi:DUF2157 domain-containing protein [Halorubrum sp. DTA46]|uniref:DUF2157 domain-containing protein n=1 Tax=Halorubrum sp. DTA46 TaxID=3402162 RepID=UPI003AAFEC57